jgi:FixJ family two-component response regulator
VLLSAIRQALARQRAHLADALAVNALRARLMSLTPREGEVLRWVIGGALNKQIAAHLGIAEKTVKIHRDRVMEKLTVGSVAELVSLCQQAGVRRFQVSQADTSRVARAAHETDEPLLQAAGNA